MTNIKYCLIEDELVCGDDTRISYGISAYSGTESEYTPDIRISVHDITSDKNRIINLINLCNQLELSSIHLHDVIDDFLAD